ncbi:MAG: peptidase S41, partial [Paludibacteraceae bacterium]|nr:peptidase S41 [Paludibacteraceae bacterium]
MVLLRKTLLILALLPLVVCAQDKPATTRADESIAIFTDVLRQVDVNYVDTLNYEDLTETAINAMLRKIDPYTVYYPKKNDKDLRMLTTGKYGGIGSIIQQREGKTYAVNPYEGKPAQVAGIQAGDRILSV